MRQKTKKQLVKPKPVRQVIQQTAEGQFTGQFEQDCQAMGAVLTDACDAKRHEFTALSGQRICLYSYGDLVNTDVLSNNVLRPLQAMTERQNAETISKQVISASQTTTAGDALTAAWAMACGVAVLLLEGSKEALLVNLLQVEHRPIERAQSEAVIIGPHENFSESLSKNIALLRRLLTTPSLKTRMTQVGRLSRTNVAVIYLADVAEPALLEEAMERLRQIDVDHIEGAAYLIDFLEDNALTLFPLLRVTERPQRVMAALSDGRVVIMADGDPTALVAPTFFPEYIQSSEDYYERPLVGTFLRGLRLLSAFLGVFLPGIWIAMVVFHHGIIPRPLFSSIVAGRENVPLPSVLESFLLLIAFDIVIEASTRLPKAVGQAVGIVGAIILGQSAVQANLVSPAMTIVVALAGLSTYTSPSPSLNSPMRLLKYVFLVAGSVFGLYGMVWALIALGLHLTSLRSFGHPYLFPVAPFDWRGLLDIVVRRPLYCLQYRPRNLAEGNERRMADNLAPAPGKEPSDE